MLGDHPDWNDSTVAKHCGVSHQTVGRVRKELAASCPMDKIDSPVRQVTRNGKTYTQDTPNIGKSKVLAETWQGRGPDRYRAAVALADALDWELEE